MCGINGFNFEDETLISRMNLTNKHRGPDGSAVYVKEGISFGHNRLSILDLSTAADQPMESADGRYIIVFNGEIYNFRELKKELITYKFKTSGDTEVILAAYIEYGLDCFEKLNGIFSLAIYDKEKKELIVARDPLGVKPFFYHFSGGRFLFSSEIKSLLEYSDLKRKLDIESLNLYLRFLYVPGPRTMLADVKKLEPGYLGIIRSGQLTLKKYKYWSKVKKLDDTADIYLQTKNKIEEAVVRQMVSDRPLGVYLSGGLDSSILLNCVSKKHKAIDTFSVGFDLPDPNDKERFNADFNLARKTAEFYGAKHHEILLSAEEVSDNFEKVIWYMDEPIGNATAWPLFALSHFAKKEVDVVFGGNGGDELFGGYERYRLSWLAKYYQKVPAFLRSILNRLSTKFAKLNIAEWSSRWLQLMAQKDKEVAPLVSARFYQSDLPRSWLNNYYSKPDEQNNVDWFMELDQQTWLNDFALALDDRMSMANGIEGRVPLLDLELVDWSRRLPLSSKIGLFGTKLILKKAFRGELPGYLFSQPKRGFFSPGAKWLRNEKFKKKSKEILNPDYYPPIKELFNWGEIDKYLVDHENSKVYHFNLLWSLMIFIVWANRFKVKI
jgi:asparagine synthase (glutamine-hydrolysing)